MGVNRAVKIKKKREIPSTPKRTDPGIHSNFFKAWNCPSPSKDAHKKIVAANVNKDHSKVIFFNTMLFSLVRTSTLNIPNTGNKIINSDMPTQDQGNETWTHNLLLPKQTIHLLIYSL